MDNNSSTSQVGKLEEKLKAANLPQDLNEKINGMLSMLKVSLQNPGGSFINYESVSGYIDWVLQLPFNKQTEDLLDLTKAKQILDKNHYGLETVKNEILEYLAALMLNLKNNGADTTIRAPIINWLGWYRKNNSCVFNCRSNGKKIRKNSFWRNGRCKIFKGTIKSFSRCGAGSYC
jgi:ATP-dependent Lon protease